MHVLASSNVSHAKIDMEMHLQVINLFFVIILVWMNIVFGTQPPTPGSVKDLAIVWLISGYAV